MELCPENINIEILREIKLHKRNNPGATFTAKDKYIIVQRVMEEELQLAIVASESSTALKNSVSAHNAQFQVQNEIKKRSFSNGRLDLHDCNKSRTCNTNWAGLGCSKLYELATVDERKDFLKERKLCFKCGRSSDEDHTRLASGKGYMCEKDNLVATLPVRCTERFGQNKRSRYSVATCDRHAPGNASRELINWLDKNKIKSTIASIFVAPAMKDCNANRNPPQSTEMNKTLRSKLQSGKESRYFTNDQLRELFAKDLQVSQEKVSPMPEGEVSFIFTLIEGRRKGIQVFVDSGCNCAIFKDGIPQTELNSCKLQDGPIPIDIATGASVNALGEWDLVCPLLMDPIKLLEH